MENRNDAVEMFFSRYDDSTNRVPVIPFVMATYGRFQDMLLVGPASLDKHLVVFKEQLFSANSELLVGTVGVRVFDIGRYVAIATVLTTTVVDDTNRTGLRIALGVLSERRFAVSKMEVVVELLRLFFTSLNERLSSSLPESGADTLMLAVQAAQRDKQPVYPVKEAFDSIIISARLIGELYTTAVPRRWWKKRLPNRYPRAVIYDKNIPALDVLAMIIKQRTTKFPIFVRRVGRYIGRKLDMQLVPVDTINLSKLGKLRSAKLEYFQDNPFIMLD